MKLGLCFFTGALALAFTPLLTAAPAEQAVLTQNFCYSVAISGDTVVAGAWLANGLTGAAYVYTRSGTTWTQQAVLSANQPGGTDFFGESVAISGDLIIVGAPGEQSNATHVYGNAADNSHSKAGAAYIFKRSGTTWTQQAYLKAHNTRAGSRFGSSVSISGTTAVVGSGISKTDWSGTSAFTDPAGESSNAKGINGNGNDTSAPVSGAAYVYEFSDNIWKFDAYLKASNTDADDSFGYAVATDGQLIVVGAPGEDSAATGVNGNQADNSLSAAGAAYVFARGPGRQWAQQAYLKPDTHDVSSFGNTGRAFGGAVTVAGNTAVVGIAGDFFGHPAGGRAWVFTRSQAGVWAQQQALAPLVAGSYFGYSLGLSGDTLVVGECVLGDPSGAAVSYTGDAHVFTRNDDVWTRQAVINPSGADALAGAGYSVAIDGGTFVVGTGINFWGSHGQNRTWIYTGAGVQNIGLEQPSGTALVSGGTKTLGILPGSSTDTVFTTRNTGTQPLNLTGTPNRVAHSGSGDFSVIVQPASPLAAGASTTFTVRFTPATAGLKTATLTIPSDDPDTSSYTINLSGRGLSTTDDTDGDGLSDAAEYNFASLGFDWQVSQPAQVSTYFANANNAGLFNQTQYNNNRVAGQADVTSNPNAFSLYSLSQYNNNRTAGQADVLTNPNPFGLYDLSQVQSLNVGVPLLQKNPTTGKFTLTIGVKQSANPANSSFTDFPMIGADIATRINGAGKLEFEFSAIGRAAFYRVQSQ